MLEARREAVTETLFECYVAGLRDSSCCVDPGLVRFGFVASAALRVGLFQVLMLGEAFRHNDNLAEDGVEHGVPDCFEVTMANEAYKLLDSFWQTACRTAKH